MENPDFDDLKYIGRIVNNDMVGIKVSTLNIEPMVKYFFTLRKYVNRASKKLSLVYDLNEIEEIKSYEKETDLHKFLLEKLRAL